MNSCINESYFPSSYSSPKRLSNLIIFTDFDKMKEKDFMEFAGRVPSFTTKQAAAFIGSMNYAKVFLSKLVAKGQVQRLARGYYTVHEDPVIYASSIIYPCYISNLYAFSHYGVTTQLPVRLEVVAPKNKLLEDVELIRSNTIWGFKQINYRGFRIFIALLEKAILDSILTQRVALSEIQNAIASADMLLLEEFALKLPVSDMKKVGYVVQSAGFMLEELHTKVRKDRNMVSYQRAKGPNVWRVRQ